MQPTAVRRTWPAPLLAGLLLACQPVPPDESSPPADTTRGNTGGATANTGGSGPAGGSGGIGSLASGGSGGGGGSGGSSSAASGGTGGSAAGATDAPVQADGNAQQGADAAAPASDASSAPAAGCGARNPGGMFTIKAGAAQTPYRVVLPASYDPGKRYPVVFYLHGRGNGIEGQGNLNRDIAEANLGIVVYPKSFGGTGWEVPGRDKPAENLALLRALIQHLGTQYCVDSKKIVMTGFSSGCWFASRLACTMKDELLGVVAAACGLDAMGKCPDKKPVTYIIGRGDAAFAGAPAAAEFYRTRNGCMMTRKAAATAPCEGYDGCAAGAPATYCVHPGGHQWPGFASKSVLDLLGQF